MESNDVKIDGDADANTEDTQGAVNSSILDYYKKFGRKRDLEQYFSLSTAQGEVKDPSGLFWRRMKSQTDSSDSGEKQSDSSTELCRISIRCAVPEQSSSQDEVSKRKSDSESPPIITEDAALRHTDDESVKSDDNRSQKSIDAILDTSINKPLSPSSSITSQRKLEWDSLADVGYGNESDRKTSASSLSTLERLALQQQYSINDTKHNTDLGPPTAHSTPLDQTDAKNKNKKSFSKKTTLIQNKDNELIKLNMPHTSDRHPQAINVNLTKHISFNVEKNGGVTIENIVKDVNVSPEKVSVETEMTHVSPEKVSVETEMTPQIKFDKEIQTSLTKSKEKFVSPLEAPDVKPVYIQKVPVLINLNTLRKRNRRKKLKIVRRKMRTKKNEVDKENVPVQEKSGAQVSEAESFEYMPGHIYNQNQLKQINQDQMKQSEPKLSSAAGNKSSLESSGALTTDSSKASKHSFTKDLEKSIDVLKASLQHHYDDSNIKKKLIKEIVLRLIKSRYRGDDSTTDFLSGLSFQSKKMGLGESHTTTSTSDGNHTGEKVKSSIPKKSILRLDKFNSNGLPSTSQSAPNLPSVSNCEKLLISKLTKVMSSSTTESDVSSKGRNSSETGFGKTSSEELYQKYLEALRREEAYKRHLRDKEHFLRQKLVSSETAFKVPVKPDLKTNNNLKDLLKDLTRNNYDDGSGDASKFEGGSNSNVPDCERFNGIKKQRSHSVFTLSSGNSDGNKKTNLKKRLQNEIRESKAENIKDLNCQCGCQMHHKNFKIDLVDSSVQVDVKHLNENNPSLEREKAELLKDAECRRASTKKPAHVISDSTTGDIRYICLCSDQGLTSQDVPPPKMLIYKCSRLHNNGIQLEISPSLISNNESVQCADDGVTISKKDTNICQPSTSKMENDVQSDCFCENTPLIRTTQSSQTNIGLTCVTTGQQNPVERSLTSSSESSKKYPLLSKNNRNLVIHEATRCIQTEISINPKISDPALSDVNIVEDNVKLVDEKYRKISKPNLESGSNINSASCTDIDTASGKSGKSLSRTFDVQNYPDNNVGVDVTGCVPLPMPSLDKEDQSNIKMDEINSDIVAEPTGDNYEIPIQGTNMKLIVCIGSNIRKSAPMEQQGNDTVAIQSCSTDVIEKVKTKLTPVEQQYTVASQVSCIDKTEIPENKVPSVERKLSIITQARTDEIEITESTSPFEHNITVASQEIGTNIMGIAEKCCSTKDYSQGVQSQTSDIFKDVEKETETSQHVPKRCDTVNKNQKELSEVESMKPFNSRKSSIVDTSDANKKNIYNTYPRYVQINESKPFERSNTDSGRIKDITNTLKKNAAAQDSKVEIVKDDTDSLLDKYSCKESLRRDLSDKEHEDTISDDPIISCKSSSDGSKDAILDIIKDITRRYSKKDVEKDKRKKCFKEIIHVLNYLLATEDGDDNQLKTSGSSTARDDDRNKQAPKKVSNNNNNDKRQKQFKGDDYCNKQKNDKKIQTETRQDTTKKQDKLKVEKGTTKLKMIDKAVQLCPTKSKGNKEYSTESSEMPKSDLPTSSDSATCKVLNKIKRECEKYHQRRCKSYHTAGNKCDASSSTSITCDQCRRIHHCSCRGHKCKGHKHKPEKPKKECVAYNLIIQTSDSMVSEEISAKNGRALQNIIVKVPSSRRKEVEKVPFKELSAKIEKKQANSNGVRLHRSRSLPNDSEVSSIDDCGKEHQLYSVRDYLERNRPEFVERSSDRQNCLKIIKERRADERAAHRQLLSLQLATQPAVSALSETELRDFAKELGFELRQKKLAPKFISEKEMKKHSEKIYKSLPEVVQKKEDKKKENIKKTNLIMANIFKKNLQKKTLRGAVNLSNYSTVIKI